MNDVDATGAGGLVGRGRPSVIYVRVTPHLCRAVQRAASAAGVSVNTFALQTLASAVAPHLHALSAESMRELSVVPDSVPLSAADHRRARRLAEVELQTAKTVWRDRFFGTPEFGPRQRSMSDQDFLDWYRNEWLVEIGERNRFVFKRGD